MKKSLKKITGNLANYAKEDKTEYEVCVLCGKQADIKNYMPVDLRECYVKGAGQLCRFCWHDVYK